MEESKLVRSVLYSSRANVDLITEMLRQAMCLSFRYGEAIRMALQQYSEWIHMVSVFFKDFY